MGRPKKCSPEDLGKAQSFIDWIRWGNLAHWIEHYLEKGDEKVLERVSQAFGELGAPGSGEDGQARD
jgi:hypothetical protein